MFNCRNGRQRCNIYYLDIICSTPPWQNPNVLFYSSLVGEEVASAILNALIPMGSQILCPTSGAIGFSELMVVMATLAGAGSGSGHVALCTAAAKWLELW